MITQAKILAFPASFCFGVFFYVCFFWVGGVHVRKSKIHWFHLFADYDLENGGGSNFNKWRKCQKCVTSPTLWGSGWFDLFSLIFLYRTVKSWKWESVLVTTPNYSIKTLYIHSEHRTDHSAQMCLDAFTNMLDVMQSLAYCAGWFLRRFQDFVTVLFPLDLLFFFYLKCTCEKLENVGSWVFFIIILFTVFLNSLFLLYFMLEQHILSFNILVLIPGLKWKSLPMLLVSHLLIDWFLWIHLWIRVLWLMCNMQSTLALCSPQKIQRNFRHNLGQAERYVCYFIKLKNKLNFGAFSKYNEEMSIQLV